MRYLVLFSAFAVVLFSCSKGTINVAKYSGAYNIYKYEIRYFNGDDSQDSVLTLNDVAHLGLYDNSSTFLNKCVYTSNSVPRSWVDYGVDMPQTWFSDNGRGNTITLSGSDLGQFVIYTVEKESRKKYKWTLVYTTSSGSVNYIETLYLEKTK